MGAGGGAVRPGRGSGCGSCRSAYGCSSQDNDNDDSDDDVTSMEVMTSMVMRMTVTSRTFPFLSFFFFNFFFETYEHFLKPMNILLGPDQLS